jgi:hypothetical protein
VRHEGIETMDVMKPVCGGLGYKPAPAKTFVANGLTEVRTA